VIARLSGANLRWECVSGNGASIEGVACGGAAALPGKSLVVLDPDLGLAVDIFPCEDGHAQERR
jgi:hypothetical protein